MMRTLQANNERREPTKKRDQQPLKQIMNELRAIVRFSTLKCSWSPPPSPRFYRYSSADEVINQGIQCSCILANWDRNSENHFLWIHNFTCTIFKQIQHNMVSEAICQEESVMMSKLQRTSIDPGRCCSTKVFRSVVSGWAPIGRWALLPPPLPSIIWKT